MHKSLHGYADRIDNIGHGEFDKTGGEGSPDDDEQTRNVEKDGNTSTGNNCQTNQDCSTH